MRRRTRSSLTTTLLLLGLAVAVSSTAVSEAVAQTVLGQESAISPADTPTRAPRPLTDLPGYFPLEELGLVPRENLSVEINLSGAMLRLLGRMAAAEDADFARLVSGLDAIRVRIAPLAEGDRGSSRARIAEGARWLEQRRWQTVLRARDEEEEVAIYVRELGGATVGMTVLAIDSEEITVVNILGDVDLAALGGLTDSLDLPSLVDTGGED